MQWFTAKIGNILRKKDGVTAIEYALIASFIALVIFGAVGVVGVSLNDTFMDVSGAF